MSSSARDAAEALRGVLMAMRVKGRAADTMLAEAVGTGLDEVRTQLDAADARGEVRRVDVQGRWALTERGRAILRTLHADAAIDLTGLAARYDEFLAHDGKLKEAITAWQCERSASRLGAVRAVGLAATPLLEQLTAIDRRYACYAARLARALARVQRGDDRAVAKPGADSVHQVWFELHEDLLQMLGRARSS